MLPWGTFLNLMPFLDFAPGREIYYFRCEGLSSAFAMTILHRQVLNWPIGNFANMGTLFHNQLLKFPDLVMIWSSNINVRQMMWVDFFLKKETPVDSKYKTACDIGGAHTTWLIFKAHFMSEDRAKWERSLPNSDSYTEANNPMQYYLIKQSCFPQSIFLNKIKWCSIF